MFGFRAKDFAGLRILGFGLIGFRAKDFRLREFRVEGLGSIVNMGLG